MLVAQAAHSFCLWRGVMPDFVAIYEQLKRIWHEYKMPLRVGELQFISTTMTRNGASHNLIAKSYLKNLFRRATSGAFLDHRIEKREAYRAAFHQFDPFKIEQMTEQDIDRCMEIPGYSPSGKLEAIVKNAKAYLAMEKCGENFQ